jgi:flagellin-specific chaperone FliS
MSKQWLKAMAPDVIEGLLEDLVADAGEEELIAILFNLLQNALAMAGRGAETGRSIMQREGVIGAVAILSFLRDHLRDDTGNLANGVLRRFYNAAHRQIIRAHRDEAVIRFREIRQSISRVIQKPYSSSFFYNCMEETEMSRAEMLDLLLSCEVRQCICRIDQSIFAFSSDVESGQA